MGSSAAGVGLRAGAGEGVCRSNSALVRFPKTPVGSGLTADGVIVLAACPPSFKKGFSDDGGGVALAGLTLTLGFAADEVDDELSIVAAGFGDELDEGTSELGAGDFWGLEDAGPANFSIRRRRICNNEAVGVSHFNFGNAGYRN
jgi:hypothetical protein